MVVRDGAGDVDPVMLELFAAEADMHLPLLGKGLLALEKGNAGAADIECMMRAAHSIKGAARIVGNDAAVRIAHTLEDCFTAAKEGRITLPSSSVDVLLQGVDALQRSCSPTLDERVDPDETQLLLQRIAAISTGQPTPNVTASALVSAAAPPNSHGGGEMLVLPQALDDSTVESLRGALLDQLRLGTDPVRLNFGEMTHLTAPGLALLLSFAGEAKGSGSPPVMEAHHVSPVVRALFRVVGLESAFLLQ